MEIPMYGLKEHWSMEQNKYFDLNIIISFKRNGLDGLDFQNQYFHCVLCLLFYDDSMCLKGQNSAEMS